MRINNVNLNTKIVGTGVPFIWAHGLMGSMAFEDSVDIFKWEEIAKIARLVRYDARGHGQSEASNTADNYHWAELAKDMIALAHELELDRFIAGGQSMGCMTSVYTALTAPEQTSGVVLVNPATAWETRAAQSKIYSQLAHLVEVRGVRIFAHLSQHQSSTPGWLLEAQPEIDKAFLESVQGFDAKVLAEVLRGAELCNLPPREELRKIEVPALILAWVEDPTHPLETAEEFADLIPDSQLVIAENGKDLSLWPQLIADFVLKLS